MPGKHTFMSLSDRAEEHDEYDNKREMVAESAAASAADPSPKSSHGEDEFELLAI